MITSPADVAAVNSQLALTSSFRVIGACIGTCEGVTTGTIEIAHVYQGEILQRWDFDLECQPVRNPTLAATKSAVRAAYLARFFPEETS